MVDQIYVQIPLFALNRPTLQWFAYFQHLVKQGGRCDWRGKGSTNNNRPSSSFCSQRTESITFCLQ